MASVLVFQRKKQVEKLGLRTASWICQWREPSGRIRSKSFGKGSEAKRTAERYAKKLEAELLLGQYEEVKRQTWDEFILKFETLVMANMGGRNHSTYSLALRHFKRIMKPNRTMMITTEFIDRFIAVRSREPGQKAGTEISPATLHKELACLRAVFRKAKRWGYIEEVPEIAFPVLPKKLKSHISSDEFAAIYSECDVAKLPRVPNVNPGDWWRGILTVFFLTGWRMSQVLAIRWDHIDLDEFTILSPNDANKGNRDEFLPVHPIIVDHLTALRGSFSDLVFPFDRSIKRMFDTFHAIQKAAGIVPKNRDGYYGFHDLRRGFATLNADKMDLFQLRDLMQHKSLKTTEIYVQMARRLQQPVDQIVVPDILKKTAE